MNKRSTPGHTLQPLDSLEVPRFAGLSTFMRMPFRPDCDGVDIGLVGVPFDFPTNRGATRHGPAQVRDMSRMIRRYNARGDSPYDLCNVADLGDAPFNPLDPIGSIPDIVAFFAKLAEKRIVPISCGGDHGMTYPAMKGTFQGTPMGVVHFDSHPDTNDELYGDRYNHGTLLIRGVEEGFLDPQRIISVGLRGTRFDLSDRDFNGRSGMRVIDFDEYEELGRSRVIEEIRRVVGDGPTYITFDMDCLDPAHCPGTGAPEPGGFSMRDAQVMIRSLSGLDIVGADVCEIAPPLDPYGITALNAANIMFELLCITAQSFERRHAAPARSPN